MDVLSHGLWGVALSRHKIRWWVAALSGALGDVISFLPARIDELIAGNLNVNHEVRPIEEYPALTQLLYNGTHSLSGLITIFLIIYLLLKLLPKVANYISHDKPPSSILALALWITAPWAVHIAMDIPLHTKEFFPTPLFWPIFEWGFDGIPWAQRVVIIPNVILLSIALAGSFWFSSRQSSTAPAPSTPEN
jgi:hypothetical protein